MVDPEAAGIPSGQSYFSGQNLFPTQTSLCSVSLACVVFDAVLHRVWCFVFLVLFAGRQHVALCL